MQEDLIVIKEGSTEFLIPVLQENNGPASRKVPVFYNSTMEANRDISIMLLRAVFEATKGARILDGLGASGVRGIRIANEVPGVGEVVINDVNPIARALIDKNIEHSGVTNTISTRRDVNALMHEEWFDYVDVDPFGTPVPFIDAALNSVKKGGYLGMSATDTAPLCGVYPRVCLRRYGAVGKRGYLTHEIGLRILLGYVVRRAAAIDKGATPVLSYSADHYFRAYFRIEDGAGKANRAMEQIGELEGAGPLWTGELMEHDIIESMSKDSFENITKKAKKFIETLAGEAGMPPLFYDSDVLAREGHTNPAPIKDVIERLEKEGFRASRTHFNPKGIKTDAPYDIVKKIAGDIAGE